MEIPPHRSNGLVHLSQIAKHRVEQASDVLELNQAVWVKVLKVQREEGQPNRVKISLSIKYVDQASGEDRDPEGIEAEAEERKRRPRGEAPEAPSLSASDAALKTTCPKCGGRGHLASECFNTKGQRYDMLKEEEAAAAAAMGGGSGSGRGAAPPAAGGRGRGATLPSWMTEGGGQGLGGGIGQAASSSKAPKDKKDKKDKAAKAERKERRERDRAARKAEKAARKEKKAEKKKRKRGAGEGDDGEEGSKSKSKSKSSSKRASKRRRDTSSSESSHNDGSDTEDEGPKPAAPKPAAAVAPFQPSARFAGARPGMVFHNGPSGIGYYPDLAARK